nr:hypothetical protein [Bacteroidota bacterium]
MKKRLKARMREKIVIIRRNPELLREYENIIRGNEQRFLACLAFVVDLSLADVGNMVE